MSVFKRYNLVTENELSNVKWFDSEPDVDSKRITGALKEDKS